MYQEINDSARDYNKLLVCELHRMSGSECITLSSCDNLISFP